jgi:short-subunit dehydrogenase involved in D-alanine esterification of teichoic acids
MTCDTGASRSSASFLYGPGNRNKLQKVSSVYAVASAPTLLRVVFHCFSRCYASFLRLITSFLFFHKMEPDIVNQAPHIVSETTLPAVLPESYQSSANRATSELFSLSGKTFVVTGAGRGLGITLVAAILEAGGNVACLDILPEPLPSEWLALRKIAQTSNLHLSYHECDITNEGKVQSIFVEVGKTAQQLGAPFSGVVACAGIQQKIPALDYAVADFERIMKVNVSGTFLTVKHAARIMVKTGVRGSIVMIASMSGSIANRVRTSRSKLVSPTKYLFAGSHLYSLQHQ